MIFHPTPYRLFRPMMGTAFRVPSTLRGRGFSSYPTGVYENQRLPTDSVGTSPITLENAVTGSRYRIEVASTGALVAEGDVPSASFVVNVPLYPSGNAANTLRVKVRKATAAPKYQPFQTQVTAAKAGAIAYVSQVPDSIA